AVDGGGAVIRGRGLLVDRGRLRFGSALGSGAAVPPSSKIGGSSLEAGGSTGSAVAVGPTGSCTGGRRAAATIPMTPRTTHTPRTTAAARAKRDGSGRAVTGVGTTTSAASFGALGDGLGGDGASSISGSRSSSRSPSSNSSLAEAI